MAAPRQEKEKWPEWDRNTRPPVPAVPAGSCDCQLHLYGDLDTYPTRIDVRHELPQATIEDARRVHKILGFDRHVIVHASVYDIDYRLLYDTFAGLTDPENWRAIVVVKDEVSDRELEKLNGIGCRGARFHTARQYAGYDKEHLLRTTRRVGELGWHIRLHFDPDQFEAYDDVLSKVRDVPIVIDHMGRLDFANGVDQPACRWILDKLRLDNWWMLLSNGNQLSKVEYGWDDAVPFGRAYIEAAPERMIWATDWPHVRWRKQRMMNDAEEVELLYKYADNDPGLIKKILVDNPARLHGF